MLEGLGIEKKGEFFFFLCSSPLLSLSLSLPLSLSLSLSFKRPRKQNSEREMRKKGVKTKQQNLLTITGYPRESAALSAASSEETIVPGGCLICSFCSSSYHRSRSSAASIDSGCVPQMRTLPSPEAAGIGFASRYWASGVASFRGV